MDLLKIHTFIPNVIGVEQRTGVFLLHGLGGSVKIWEKLVQLLTTCGYYCFALDVLGFNQSPDIDETVSMQQHVDYLIQTVRHCQKEYELLSLVGIGHSFGGQIIICANHDKPDLFHQIIAINSPLLEPDVMLQRMQRSILGRLYHYERLTRLTIRYVERHLLLLAIAKQTSRLILRDYYHDHIDVFFDNRRFNNYFLNTRNVILNNNSQHCLNHHNVVLIFSQRDQYMLESDIDQLGSCNQKINIIRILSNEHNPFIDPFYQDLIIVDMLCILQQFKV